MRRIDHERLHERFRATQGTKASAHSAASRIRPSLLQYDYLSLSRLATDIREMIQATGTGSARKALDLGSATSPYRAWVEARGFTLETFDVDPSSGADHVGTGDDTGLPDASFDLVLCTQVLEHVPDPLRVLEEIRRILKPAGLLIASAPHVWFYHPHPSDFWRFTQEGVIQLCADAGLELIELRAQGGSALTLVQSMNFLAYGLLGRAGALLYAALNLLGIGADAVIRNDLFTHNFAWSARKPGTGVEADAKRAMTGPGNS